MITLHHFRHESLLLVTERVMRCIERGNTPISNRLLFLKTKTDQIDIRSVSRSAELIKIELCAEVGGLFVTLRKNIFLVQIFLEA